MCRTVCASGAGDLSCGLGGAGWVGSPDGTNSTHALPPKFRPSERSERRFLGPTAYACCAIPNDVRVLPRIGGSRRITTLGRKSLALLDNSGGRFGLSGVVSYI